ncbi:MAG: hypothetical protein HQ555_02025 [Candidatus Aminicenantes bacterium]|nr:hypothetical protein [Candidatus Aminicenantes bacterium]
MSGSSRMTVLGSDIDSPIEDFTTDFNNYLDDYNKSTSLQNVLAGVGYLAAAVVAMIAVLIELKVL